MVRDFDAGSPCPPGGGITIYRVVPAAFRRIGVAIPVSERETADRKRRAVDREAYLACRAALRRILSAALDRPPAEIAIEISKSGQPSLADDVLSFSISHTDGLSLVAVADTPAVGVDVECRDRPVDVERLAADFLASADQAKIAATSPSERRCLFFDLWTRNEALVKATGRGLVCPADDRVPGASSLIVIDVDVGSRWSAAIVTRPHG